MLLEIRRNERCGELSSIWLVQTHEKSQQLFRSCFRCSMFLNFWRYTSCAEERPILNNMQGIPIRWVRRPVWRFDKIQRVVADHQHTLHSLLPPESTITYNLRPRAHNLTLPDKHCALDSCNFVTRMLYANCYWHCDHYFNLSFCSCSKERLTYLHKFCTDW